MQFLRPDEVASRLGLAKATVYLLAKRGQIPHVRIGRSVRIPAAWLAQVERAAIQGTAAEAGPR